MANVGLSWYTWLEQGRDIQVSDSVLDNVAAALLLAEPERAYLYELAGKHAPPSQGARVERPLDQLQRIVDGYTLCPAYIVDRYWNVVAVNNAASYIFRISRETNCLEEFFTDPTIVQRYPHQDLTARMMVANFRRQAAKFPDDHRFHEVADDLSQVSPEFEKLWSKHIVDEDEHIDVVYDHEALGRVTFESTVLQITDTVDLRLFLYFAKPGSRTEQMLAAGQPVRTSG